MTEDTSWKPSKLLAVLYGLFLQPFAFLYVNRAGWFWFYFIVTFSIVIGGKSVTPESPLFNLLEYGIVMIVFAIIASVHAFLLAKNYNDDKRHWFAKWWMVLAVVIAIYAIVYPARIFLVEPYSLPAASMSPSLNVGDHILVNKQGYGNHRTMGIQFGRSEPTKHPERGDIIIFQHPEEPHIDYIKRVIGLPGDTIVYNNKTLFLKPACEERNKECPDIAPVEKEFVKSFQDDFNVSQYNETIDSVTYAIQHLNERTDYSDMYFFQPGSRRGEWVVPANHYFVLGDNRDNSRDSRYWGFVPEENIVGDLLFVW